jgi:plastocyanin
VRRHGAAAVLGILVVSCGGSGGGPSSPSGGSTEGRTITITPGGATPTTLTVIPGTRVLFVNNDTRSHNMTSDPHPEHDACPEINAVGFLSPGQSRETGNLNAVRTCGFHDHDDPPPGGSRWTGSITIR